jgi:cupin fold WbuC family metalloprotein
LGREGALKRQAEGVFVAAGSPVLLERADIAFLKEEVERATRGRVRICAHPTVSHHLQEMFIVLSPRTYIRPHKHLGKTESLFVVEGAADAVFFDDDGAIVDVFRLGDYSSGLPCYYRIDEPVYHTLVVRSGVFVFHETAQGPFVPDSSVGAWWAPPEGDPACGDFMSRLAGKASEFLRAGWPTA